MFEEPTDETTTIDSNEIDDRIQNAEDSPVVLSVCVTNRSEDDEGQHHRRRREREETPTPALKHSVKAVICGQPRRVSPISGFELRRICTRSTLRAIGRAQKSEE
jgi:hypothetical protein